MKPKRWLKIGFTLTEVLIVVVIVGLLATLALPMFVKTLEKAKLGEVISNLNLIRTGQKMYFLEYGEFATQLADLNIEDPNDNTANNYFLYGIGNAPGGFEEDFCAWAKRGAGGAIPAPQPYDDDVYEMCKDGKLYGKNTPFAPPPGE